MIPNAFMASQQTTTVEYSLAPYMEELSIPESAAFLSLAGKVFTSPRRYGFGSGDEAAEAFIHYKKRLRSIIRRSGTIVGNKDAYIDSCLRFLAKSVQRSLRHKEMVDFVLESAGETGGCFPVQTESGLASFPAMGTENQQFIGSIAPSCFLTRMNAEEKRLLYLVVKCAWEVDDSMAEKSAARLGVPILWLCSILHQARASLESGRQYLGRMNERINTLWVRLRLIEAELRGDNVGQERRENLVKSAELCRSRYESLLARKARFHLLVSNREIAELLRVPKGSVDSGLFYLKAGLKEKLEEP